MPDAYEHCVSRWGLLSKEHFEQRDQAKRKGDSRKNDEQGLEALEDALWTDGHYRVNRVILLRQNTSRALVRSCGRQFPT